VEKLNWLNFQHLRLKPDHEVLAMLKEHLEKSGIAYSNLGDQYLLNVITAMRERVSFIKDFTEKSPYFFSAPKEYDPAVVAKRWKPDSADYLRELMKEFSKLTDPQKGDYEAALHRTAESLKVGKR